MLRRGGAKWCKVIFRYDLGLCCIMEHPLNNVSFILVIWILAVSPSTAHYCVWGLCESWEYCCAENVCCANTNYYNIWTTVLIIAAIVIGSVLAGMCLYYNLQRIYTYLQQKYYLYKNINSVSIPSEFESDARTIRIIYE